MLILRWVLLSCISAIAVSDALLWVAAVLLISSTLPCFIVNIDFSYGFTQIVGSELVIHKTSSNLKVFSYVVVKSIISNPWSSNQHVNFFSSIASWIKLSTLLSINSWSNSGISRMCWDTRYFWTINWQSVPFSTRAYAGGLSFHTV